MEQCCVDIFGACLNKFEVGRNICVYNINSEKVASTSVSGEAINLWSCEHNAGA